MLPIDKTETGDARNRRTDAGVVELGLCIGNRGFVRSDLGVKLLHHRSLSVGLLPRREFAELGIALQVEFGVGEIGFILRFLGLGLVERGLVRPWIDLGEQVALLTSSPSLKAILSIWPSTRVRTTTVLKPCTVPSPVR